MATIIGHDAAVTRVGKLYSRSGGERCAGWVDCVVYWAFRLRCRSEVAWDAGDDHLDVEVNWSDIICCRVPCNGVATGICHLKQHIESAINGRIGQSYRRWVANGAGERAICYNADWSIAINACCDWAEQEITAGLDNIVRHSTQRVANCPSLVYWRAAVCPTHCFKRVV